MQTVQSELSDDISMKVQRQMMAMNKLSEAQSQRKFVAVEKTNYINVIESGN
jgi:hypothetical protein